MPARALAATDASPADTGAETAASRLSVFVVAPSGADGSRITAEDFW